MVVHKTVRGGRPNPDRERPIVGMSYDLELGFPYDNHRHTHCRGGRICGNNGSQATGNRARGRNAQIADFGGLGAGALCVLLSRRFDRHACAPVVYAAARGKGHHGRALSEQIDLSLLARFLSLRQCATHSVVSTAHPR